MTNTTIHANLIDGYNACAYTHDYIFGFTFEGVVYMATLTKDALPLVTCLDRASRGAGYALRFCPNHEQKVYLMQFARALCSVKYFNDLYAESKYNKGEIFEKLVTEHFGQEWVKDTVPFYKDGDITVKGRAFQIKFEKATFCNEKSLLNAIKICQGEN